MSPGSAPIELLPALRRLDADGLARLLLARRVPLRGVSGLIDLAEWLRSPAGVDRALDKLGWRRMRRLAEGDAAELGRAAERLLAGGEPVVLLPEVASAIEEALDRSGGPATSDPADGDAASPDEVAGLAHAAEAAFAALTLAGELLHALDAAPRAVREDREGPRLAGVESRRIAGDLGIEPELASTLARLAVAAGLAGPADGALVPSEAGRAWLRAPMTARWRVLAEAWLDRLGAPERRELIEFRAPGATSSTPGGGQARDAGPAATGEPSADTGAITTRRSAESAARALGVLADERLSPIGRLVLDDRVPEAAARLEAAFPSPVDRVYLQPDCSIIAPGPLRPDLDERLREIAVLEQPGLAATYRLTRASIHRALADGADRDEVLALLDELALGPVPQPARYLVEESAARYGSIRVRPHADPFQAGCRVLAEDARLLDALEVDRALAALGLARVGANELAARAGAEGAYWSLAEAGHPVAAETADGRPWTPRRRVTAPPERGPAVPPGVERLVAALIDDPAREDGADGDEAWLRRRLELARREKQPVRLAIEHAGSRTELFLIPTSVAGPRLRGRDAAADVERTIPISSIAELLEP